jgi:hypothetical protein
MVDIVFAGEEEAAIALDPHALETQTQPGPEELARWLAELR